MAVVAAAIHRGTAVLVRLPNDKARPAVVVRSELLSELSYATVLPITLDLREGTSLRDDLQPSAGSGLVAAASVMTDWPQTMRRITQQLAIVMGLADGRAGRV
jgi:mRNA interferase MazF